MSAYSYIVLRYKPFIKCLYTAYTQQCKVTKYIYSSADVTQFPPGINKVFLILISTSTTFQEQILYFLLHYILLPVTLQIED